jgi:hypothetical protein
MGAKHDTATMITLTKDAESRARRAVTLGRPRSVPQDLSSYLRPKWRVIVPQSRKIIHPPNSNLDFIERLKNASAWSVLWRWPEKLGTHR